MYAIKHDLQGNIIIGGAYRNGVDFDLGPTTYELSTTYTVSNLFVLKMDPDGNFIWVREGVGAAETPGDPSEVSTNEVLTSFDIDSENNILFTGYFHLYINFEPSTSDFIVEVGNTDPIGVSVFLAKMDNDGNMVWARALEGNYNSTVTTPAATVNKGHVVSFNDEGKLSLGTTFYGVMEYELNDSQNSYDTELAPVVGIMTIDGNTGDIEEAYFLDSTQGVDLYDMTANGDYVHATGFFINTIQFDNDTSITSTAMNHDAFVAKFSPVTLGDQQFSKINPIVYPNPAKNYININAAGFDVQSITITDIMGKVIKEVSITTETPAINIEGIAAGNYLLSLKGINGTTVKKIVIE